VLRPSAPKPATDTLALSRLPRSPLATDAIHAIYDGLHNTVNDSTCRQAHSNAVTDLELSFIWLLWGLASEGLYLSRGALLKYRILMASELRV